MRTCLCVCCVLAASSSAATAQAIQVSPTSLEFPVVQAESDSVTLPIVVTNTSTDPTSFLEWNAVLEAPFGDFTIDYGCVPPPQICGFGAGESATVVVTFRPLSNSVQTNVVRIDSNDPANPRVEVPISGHGDYPMLAIDSPSGLLDLGGAFIGHPTAPGTLVGRNASGVSTYFKMYLDDRFTLVSGPETAILDPGQIVTWTITCTPTLDGLNGAWIHFDTNAYTPWLDFPAQCMGYTAGATATPDRMDFGTVDMPAGATREVRLDNPNSAPFTVLGIASSAPGDFTVSGIGPGTAIPGGGSLTFAITSNPSLLGHRRGTLTIDLDAIQSIAIPLTATGADPDLTVETTGDFALDLGTVDVDVGAKTGVVRLHNQRATDVAIASCAIAGDPALSVASGCPVTIAAGATAEIAVAFDPSAEAASSGTLTLTGTGFATGAIAIELAGLGIDQHVAVEPLSVMFSPTFRHPTAPAVLPVMIHNTGTTALAMSAVAVTGDAFSLASPAPTSIAVGDTAVLSVAFAPLSSGDFTGTLVIGNADDPAIARVALAGRGIDRAIAIDPTTLDLGSIAVGDHLRVADAIGIRNIDASASFTVTGVTLDGADALHVIGPDVATIAPGDRAQLGLDFAPLQAGTYNATVRVFFDGDPDPQATILVTALAIEAPPPADGGGCGCAGTTPETGLTFAVIVAFAIRRRRLV